MRGLHAAFTVLSPVIKLLGAVRAHFGFSQRQLAPWLGVSYRLIAYVELGTRSLPDAAFDQLLRLAALLRDRLATCQFELVALRREQAAAATLTTAARRQLQAVTVLLPTVANDGERLWLELRQLEASRVLRRQSTAAEILGLARLAALEAEVAALQKFFPE